MDFPTYEFREKVADACVHACGILAVLVSIPYLISVTAANHDMTTVMAVAVFGLGTMFSFAMSASYNMVETPGAKAILRRLDHAAIFLMIGAAYTPIAGVIIGGTDGTLLLCLVWALSLSGMVLRVLEPSWFRQAPVVFYLLLGWAALGVAESLFTKISPTGLALFFTCGLLYTIGVVFFRWESLRYHNAIWHVFVLVATGFLYAGIYHEIA